MTLDKTLKELKYVALSASIPSFAAGAYCAYQEEMLGVQDHTFDSQLIQSHLAISVAMGSLKGTLGTTGFTTGATIMGAISYTAISLGYFTGKTACYFLK